jgi:hypothetical protein
MSIYVVNIVIPSGSDFSQSFFLESDESDSAFNLTNYSVYSMIKKSPLSLTTAANFNASVVSPPTQGQIIISLASTITAALKPGRYSYDVLIKNDSSGLKSRVIEGSALVTAGITTTV